MDVALKAGPNQPQRWLRLASGRAAIATAIAYFLTGKIGLALALPPGYATAVWPPAGVALAAALLAEPGAAVGVFFGSFLVNLSSHLRGPDGLDGWDTTARAGGIALLIAFGAAAQAIVGARLAHRVGAYPTVAPSPASILKLFLTGGVLACLINSTLAISALVLTGQIERPEALHSWLVWWAGDVSGILTVTPIVLSFALAPAGQRWRRAAQPAAASAAVLGLTASLALAELRASSAALRSDFAARSREVAEAVSGGADMGRHAVEGLAGAFATNRQPSLLEFQAIADRLAAFGLGIRALEWLPRVEEADRTAWEEQLSGQWGRSVSIFERSGAEPRPAAARPEYFPVSYVAPSEGNESAIGFDLASSRPRLAALRKAAASGASTASSGVPLVQNGDMGILLFVPLFESAHEGEPDLLKGVVLGVISVPELLRVSLRGEFARDANYWLVDETNPGARTLLASNASGSWRTTERENNVIFGARAPLETAQRIGIADRTWVLHLAPSSAYLDRKAEVTPYLLLFAGLMAAALANGFVLIIGERQRQLADNREQDLRNQKFALDQHAIVSIADTDGRITYANDLFCAISGYSRSILLGANHNIVSSGRHPPGFYRELWSKLRAGEVWRGEICNRNTEGELYWLAATLVPLKDSRGKVKEFISICTDVTARKRLEEDLEESRAFLQSVADSMGEGVYTVDNHGRCTFLNAEAERLLGWTFAELKGQGAHAHIHFQNLDGEHIHAADCEILRGLDADGRYQSEDQYFTDRSGRLFPVAIVAKRIVEKGEALGAVIVFQDITERRLVHDRLRISEERLTVALSASGTGLWDYNPITGQAFYSDTWFRMLGHEPLPTPCSGQVFFSLLHPDDRIAYDEALEGHLKNRVSVVECEFRMRRADGTWAWVRSIGKLIEVDDDGRPLRMVGVHIDTTASHEASVELASAKDAAILATQAKSDFLATMSHEIRTPMNAIIGLAHLLARSDLSSKQRDLLHKIQNASQALLAIINDILDFSKIEAGKLSIENVEFNLDEVVKSASTLVSPKFAEKGIALVVKRAPETPADFVGDPLRLSQLLTNLLSNAAKFTVEGEVRVEIDGRFLDENQFVLSVSVSDTGIGMTEAQMARLFRPFTQADASTSRHFGGTGLGLAICRQLLHLMGGDISVTSREGAGTTFTFKTPLRLAPPPELAGQDAAALAGKRALVVDDSPSMRRMLSAALSSFGLDVEEAASGEEAERKVERPDAFDLIALDWKLPNKSGVEALKRLRQRGVTAPALLITAYGRTEVEKDLVRHFPQSTQLHVSILEKPVSAKLLRERILTAFGRALEQFPASAELSASDILLRGVRILLVEDNPINQQVATGLLETLGVETTVASSGEEAMEILATRQFDAILMDMQMPGKDGLQTTIAVRTELGLTETPIIAMTANAMAGDRERCLESGMNDYIAKPIDPDRLALTLAQWLERSGVIVSRRVEPMLEPAPAGVMARGNPAIFDRTSALHNLGGNEDLLRQLLGMFSEEHARDAQLISEAFEVQDRRRIYSLSHSLKGAASTLGARRVAELSLALETGTRPDGNEVQFVTLKSKANALAHALAEAIEDMEVSRRSAAPPETQAEAQAPPERQAALAAIDDLTKLLLSGDADAEPGAQRLADLFAGAAPSTRAHAAAVRAAAERFDFDEAQARLHRLRDDICAGD